MSLHAHSRSNIRLPTRTSTALFLHLYVVMRTIIIKVFAKCRFFETFPHYLCGKQDSVRMQPNHPLHHLPNQNLFNQDLILQNLHHRYCYQVTALIDHRQKEHATLESSSSSSSSSLLLSNAIAISSSASQ